jgi:hypothetical protein
VLVLVLLLVVVPGSLVHGAVVHGALAQGWLPGSVLVLGSVLVVVLELGS